MSALEFFSSRRAAPPPQPEPPPEPTNHHSPALRDALAAARKVERPLILDLGPAVGKNIELLTGRGARVLVADLYRALRLAGVELPLKDRNAFAKLLPPLNEPLAAILAWDLPNLLGPDPLAVLGARLAEYSPAGTPLLAEIYTQRHLPLNLPRFLMADAETLVYHLDPQPGAAAPRYHQPDLERLLQGFRTDSTSILRNGLQEYLFVRV